MDPHENGPTAVLTEREPPRLRGRLARAIWRDLRQRGPGFVATKSLDTVRRGWQLARYRINARRLVRRVDDVPIDRPIFLLGLPGGGQTVMARTLYRHPLAVYASGNSDWWAGPDEIQNCNHIYDLPEPLVHRSYHFRNVNASLEHHPRFGYQRAFLFAVDELLPRYGKTAEDVDPGTTLGFRRVIQKIALAYAHDPDHCRFVDMSHLYTVQVPYIARMLEGSDPRFILTARNPYALLARAVAKDFGPEFGSHLSDDLEGRIEFAVQHWANCMRSALEAEVPMMLLRYEDFLADPERGVRRMCEFTELDFHPHQVPGPGQRRPLGSLGDRKWYPLLADENEKYLREVDPRLVRAIHERGADLVERLGYERLRG